MDLVTEKASDIFCRWIDGIEGLQIVDELMVEILARSPQPLLEIGKIEKEAVFVDLWPGHTHLDAIVVAVYVFALAVVVAKGMSGGEGVFYEDLKHRKISVRPVNCW